MIIFAESETEVIDKLFRDAEEALVVELELTFDVIEDGTDTRRVESRSGWHRERVVRGGEGRRQGAMRTRRVVGGGRRAQVPARDAEREDERQNLRRKGTSIL